MVKNAPVLRHIGIVVSDLDKALRIFVELFGLEVKAEFPQAKGKFLSSLLGLEQVEIRIAILKMEDNNRVELLEYRSPTSRRLGPPKSNDVGISHFAMRVDDLDEIFKRSKTYDVRFVESPLDSPDGSVKVAYAVLMDEAIVELVQVYSDSALYSGGE